MNKSMSKFSVKLNPIEKCNTFTTSYIAHVIENRSPEFSFFNKRHEFIAFKLGATIFKYKTAHLERPKFYKSADSETPVTQEYVHFYP